MSSIYKNKSDLGISSSVCIQKTIEMIHTTGTETLNLEDSPQLL